MISRNKCNQLIENHIEEGNKLTKIFTKDLVIAQLYPIGTICLSTWMIESLRMFDHIGIDRIGRKTYNIFEVNLRNIGGLNIEKFENLVDCLQDVLETLKSKEITI